VQDEPFVASGWHVAAERPCLLRTSEVGPSTRAEAVRCILDSMSLAIRHAIRVPVQVTGHEVSTLPLAGGIASPLFGPDRADDVVLAERAALR
jgi:sugar (pentulose or hexulose) kinase